MTGCQLWGGTLCGPVGTTREASNMVQSGFPVPPLHVHCAPLLMENAPELLALKESTPSCPVMLRISSRPQAPASRSWPSTQARKGRGPGHNRRKHYAIFKELPPFRAWTLGTGREAGSWGRDEIRDIVGKVQFNGYTTSGGGTGIMGVASAATGALNATGTSTYAAGLSTYSAAGATTLDFSASEVVPTGPMNVPPHIWQPIILYLGRPR